MWLDWNLSDTIKFLEIGVWVIYPNNIYGSGNLLDSILSSGSGFKTCTLAATTDSSWVDPFVPFPVLPLCFNLPSPMVSQIYGLFGIRDLLRYCRCRVTWVTQPYLLLLVMGMDLELSGVRILAITSACQLLFITTFDIFPESIDTKFVCTG